MTKTQGTTTASNHRKAAKDDAGKHASEVSGSVAVEARRATLRRQPATASSVVEPTTPVTPAAAGQSSLPPILKQHQLVTLLVREEGATLDQMIAVTGWLPHTTRAALTGLRKKGYAIDSDKVDGTRTYRAVAPK